MGKKACFLPVFISFEGSNCNNYKLCSALHRITKNETWLRWLSTHALHILLNLIRNKIILELSHLQIIKSCPFGLLKNNHGILEMFVFSLLFSYSVVSDSLLPHGLQHTKLPCPSLSPGVCSNSCPLSQWSHSNHLILCRPLLLLSSVFPSIRVFSNESVLCIRWPKY